MLKSVLSGFFIIVFMIFSVGMAILYLPTAVSSSENPTLHTIMNGDWSPKFEKALNESLPVFEFSRAMWGKLEFLTFNEGRKGVQVGKSGWLFTDEEFACIPSGAANLANNIDYVAEVSDNLKARKIMLLVAVIPSKARLYESYLGNTKVPNCRQTLYQDVINGLRLKGVEVVSLMEYFQKFENNIDTLFFKADTHWTPQGAEVAAEAIAAHVDTSSLELKPYVTKTEGAKSHSGDLLRYLPGTDIAQKETVGTYVTVSESSTTEDAALSLFADSTVNIVLVGTSYSANKKWNFEGFLKQALNSDVANMADEGLGPFKTMDNYISSDAFTQTPPSVIIWEVPERYTPNAFNQKDTKP